MKRAKKSVHTRAKIFSPIQSGNKAARRAPRLSKR